MSNYSDYLKTLADRDRKLEDLVNHSFETRTWNLSDIITNEKLTDYELGYEDIIYADSNNYAIVPCEEYLILAHEHYDEQNKKVVSEYAIYSQEDHDGHPLRNSLNMNATYHFVYVHDETFESMAGAIAHAYNAIKNGTAFVDPVELMLEYTEPYENPSEEDASAWIREMKEAGYRLPPWFTPQAFLDIYHDMDNSDED